MVAGLDLAVDRAVEAGQPVVERDRAVLGGGQRQAVEAVLDRAGQLAAHVAVVVGQDRDAEVAGPAQRRARSCEVFATENDTSGGSRLTEVNELAARPTQLAVDLGGHGDHAAGEDPERLAQARRRRGPGWW